MRILVTGGLGLVGAHLIPRLLDQDLASEVLVIDNHGPGAIPEALGTLVDDQVHVVTGDVADHDLVDPLVAKCDAVIHLAAATSVDRSIEEPAAFVRSNVAATTAVVDAAVKHDQRRLIVVSTDEVWGSIDTPALADEHTPYNPTNPYAASKAASDHVVAAANNTYGLGARIVYFTTLYGPWQLPGKLISTAVRNRVLGKPVPIYGDGLAVREFTFVTDAVDGLLAIFRLGQPAERYVVGSGVRYSALEAVSEVNRIVGGASSWRVDAPERPGCDRRYAVDAAKIRRELGWAPQISFEEGIQRTASWWRAAGLELAGDGRHHARLHNPEPAHKAPKVPATAAHDS